MVFYAKDETRPQKCFFCHGTLPNFVNEAQVPQKREPFSSLWALQWSCRIDLVLPMELQEAVENVLASAESDLQYAKVMMSLCEVLEGPFFNEYIKKGNISMLSEGRPGIDNVFFLNEGILRLELDKPTYERAGLVGHAIRDGGLKHKKNRFAIEFNLRQPSMIRGKNGFERLLWACRNVLSQSLTWLFFDKAGTATDTAPIAPHHPLWMTPKPTTTNLPSTSTPPFIHPSSIAARNDKTYMTEVDEWFALVALHSSRLNTNDTLDRYLSRYDIPVPDTPTSPSQATSSLATTARDLVHLSMTGFFPASQLTLLFVRLRKCLAAAAGTTLSECTNSQISQTDSSDQESKVPFLSFRSRTFRNEVLHVLAIPSTGTLPGQKDVCEGEAEAEQDRAGQDGAMQLDRSTTDVQSGGKKRRGQVAHSPLEFLEWWVPVVP